jgi:hypothetical protein
MNLTWSAKHMSKKSLLNGGRPHMNHKRITRNLHTILFQAVIRNQSLRSLPHNNKAEASMRHFWSDQRGNIAVLFALAIVPVIGGIGAAVDYSMASAYRTDMQKSLDAAGISLAKIMPASQATLDEKGQQYFDASMGEHSLSNLVLTVEPDIVQAR